MMHKYSASGLRDFASKSMKSHLHRAYIQILQ